MKNTFVRKGQAWIVGLVLLAGLTYSVLALSEPTAYAKTTCTCTEEQQDAHSYCLNYFNDSTLLQYVCPSLPGHYFFVCQGDPIRAGHTVACD
jgi:hypothetical protein